MRRLPPLLVVSDLVELPVVSENELPPCPNCGGELHLEKRLDAKPAGTFSLAGAGLKFSVAETYWLVCLSCDFEERGRRPNLSPQ